MNILVGFCYPLLGCPIVPLCGFRFFAAIVNISFSVIDKGDVVIDKIFLQQGKIKMSETLMLAGERQLFVLCLIYIWLFAFVNIIVFEEADDCY